MFKVVHSLPYDKVSMVDGLPKILVLIFLLVFCQSNSAVALCLDPVLIWICLVNLVLNSWSLGLGFNLKFQLDKNLYSLFVLSYISNLHWQSEKVW